MKSNNQEEKFIQEIQNSLANYYSNYLAQNVKRAYEHARRQGKYFGLAPIGYARVSSVGGSEIRIDEQQAKIIKKIFELYASGEYTIEMLKDYAIGIGLKSQRGRIPSVSLIKRILNNPFYVGRARSKYGNYSHKYRKIIDDRLFDKCQKILHGNRFIN